MELPKNMRKLRLRAQITVRQAAQDSGFSDDAWYKLERGERWVGSEQRLHDIARALSVHAWQLLVPQRSAVETAVSMDNESANAQPRATNSAQ
jgi:transcriptional regulator with XRE-family HTH domain